MSLTQKDKVYAAVVGGSNTVKAIQAATEIRHEGSVRRELMELRRQGKVQRRLNQWVTVSNPSQEETASGESVSNAAEN